MLYHVVKAVRGTGRGRKKRGKCPAFTDGLRYCALRLAETVVVRVPNVSRLFYVRTPTKDTIFGDSSGENRIRKWSKSCEFLPTSSQGFLR